MKAIAFCGLELYQQSSKGDPWTWSISITQELFRNVNFLPHTDLMPEKL